MTATADAYTGYLAGLATSLFWSISPLLFTAAAKRLGPTAVNVVRLAFAVVVLGITHRLLFGHWIPEALPRQVTFLAISGVLGLSIGDQALFGAFLDIGPRLASLVMTTAPLFAAFFGWLVLGERLHPAAWLGIALTLGGVGWVVSERPDRPLGARSPRWGRGVLLAVVGSACQAGGLLLSKQGMGHGWLSPDAHMAPQAATLVRMVFAALGMLPIVGLHHLRNRIRRGVSRETLRIGSAGAGLMFAVGGAVVGPFLGVWLSLVAADRAPLGIAQTFCSLPPIFILPLMAVIHGERISRRAVLGAFVSVAGLALLFLRPQ